MVRIFLGPGFTEHGHRTFQIFNFHDFLHFWKVASSPNTSKNVFGPPKWYSDLFLKLGASGPAAFGGHGFYKMTPQTNVFGEMKTFCFCEHGYFVDVFV